jgi:hypothetical protein
MTSFDMSDTIAPKSDQLDAVDLLGGPHLHHRADQQEQRRAAVQLPPGRVPATLAAEPVDAPGAHVLLGPGRGHLRRPARHALLRPRRRVRRRGCRRDADQRAVAHRQAQAGAAARQARQERHLHRPAPRRRSCARSGQGADRRGTDRRRREGDDERRPQPDRAHGSRQPRPEASWPRSRTSSPPAAQTSRRPSRDRAAPPAVRAQAPLGAAQEARRGQAAPGPFDAITAGGAWVDDAQVVTCSWSKVYAGGQAVPGVTFTVAEAVRGEQVAA